MTLMVEKKATLTLKIEIQNYIFVFIFRSGEMLQTLEFSRILHSSTFNSMAVQARIKQNKDTLTVLFLSNLDNQIKMASIKILDDDNRIRVKAEKGTVNVISNDSSLIDSDSFLPCTYLNCTYTVKLQLKLITF